MPERRRRRKDAVPAKALVARGMRHLGPPPAVAALEAIGDGWAALVGAVGAGSRPIGLSRTGTLTVACVSAAQAQRLSDEADTLVERLADERVRDLRAVVSSAPQPATADTPSDGDKPPKPTVRPRHRVAARQVAGGVEDPALKQLVERGAAASLAREDSPAKDRKDRGADQHG